MVEVLVSLFILSLGLLGLAALQITGLKSNHMGFFRTQAAQLAYEMGDRMRANPGATTAQTYNGYTGAADYVGTGLASCVGVANVCTPAELAQFDKDQWKTGVIELPGGSGSVALAPDGTNFTITVCWNQDGPGDAVVCPPPTSSQTNRVELTI